MASGVKNAFRAALAIGTLVSLFYVPWPVVRAWLPPLPDSVQAQVEATQAMGFPGVVLFVDGPGHERQTYVAGWHDQERQIPARGDALFKLASVDKLYIAAAVSKLAAAGRLDLEAPLTAFLPAVAGRLANAESITLRLLMQHRSGIPNFTDTPNYWMKPPSTVEDTLALVYDRPADFAPDSGYAYSNTNYLLLKEIISAVTGDNHFGYVRDTILEPLGLRRTFASWRHANADDLMSGYYRGVSEDIKGADYGSMIASAADLGIFLRALNDGALLSPEEMAIYRTLYVFDHDGLIPGYQTHTAYLEDIDTVVVQFTNLTDFDGYQWHVAQIGRDRVAEILRRNSGGG